MYSLPLWGRAGVGASYRAAASKARSKPRHGRVRDFVGVQ